MTNVTLYALADQLAHTLDQIDPETGELPEGFSDLRELVAHKGAAVAAYICQREFEAEAMAARLKEIDKRIKAQRSRNERLREYLLWNMQRVGMTEIRSEDLLLSVKRFPERDEAVDIFDERQIPAAFVVTPEPPAPRPDKVAIRKAIKAGEEVPGARLIKRDRLEIK